MNKGIVKMRKSENFMPRLFTARLSRPVYNCFTFERTQRKQTISEHAVKLYLSLISLFSVEFLVVVYATEFGEQRFLVE